MPDWDILLSRLAKKTDEDDRELNKLRYQQWLAAQQQQPPPSGTIPPQGQPFAVPPIQQPPAQQLRPFTPTTVEKIPEMQRGRFGALTARIDGIRREDYLKTIPLPPQPIGDEWILIPNELPIEKDLSNKQIENRSRGLTASQYLQVIDSWVDKLNPEDKKDYLEQGNRFVEFGWINDPMQFVRLEVSDVVGFQELGLTTEKAHEFTDKLFPGLRSRFAQDQGETGGKQQPPQSLMEKIGGAYQSFNRKILEYVPKPQSDIEGAIWLASMGLGGLPLAGTFGAPAASELFGLARALPTAGKIAARVALAPEAGLEQLLALPIKGLTRVISSIKNKGQAAELTRIAKSIIDRVKAGEAIPEVELAKMPQEAAQSLREVLQVVKESGIKAEIPAVKAEIPKVGKIIPKAPITPEVTIYKEYIGATVDSKLAATIPELAGKVSGKVEEVTIMDGVAQFKVRLADKSTMFIPVDDARLIRLATEGKEFSYPREIIPKAPITTPEALQSISGAVKPPTPPITPTTGLGDIDAVLNQFGETLASSKTGAKFTAQQDIWAKERTVRAARFAELLEKERAVGTDAREAILKATAAFKGLYPRKLTGLGLPQDVKDAAYAKIIKVISEDATIPPTIKSFEITSTTRALDNALAGKPIPSIAGIKGGSAKSRLLKIFQDNKVIKEIIENPEEMQKRLLENAASAEALDPVISEYLRTLPSNAKQTGLALDQFSMLPVSLRMRVIKTLQNAGLNIIDALGIPKSVKFAFDFSMMFRQLGISGARHPISWLKTWSPYFRAMRSEKVALELDNMLRTDPERMNAIAKLGLDLYDIKKNATYWARPETMASKIAEKYIPGVRMSNRGAAVAVNYFLTDVGKTVVKNLEKAKASPNEFKAMGSLLNELVGRGEMPNFLKGTAGDILNKLLSSPRYLASRFEWQTKLLSSSKTVRQEAWSTLLAWAGIGSAILGMAKLSGFADVEGDPRSSDQMKIRIGNKRIDIWVGYAQIIRLAAQLAPYVDEEGKIDWTKGSRKTEAGRIIPVPRSELLARFAQSKESPGIGAIVTLLTGKDYVGQKIDFSALKGWGTYIKDTLAPASLEEMADAYANEGFLSSVVSSIGLGGIGISTYGDLSDSLALKYSKTIPVQMLMPDQKGKDLTYKDLNQEQRTWLLENHPDYKDAVEKGKLSYGSDPTIADLKTREALEAKYHSALSELAKGVLSGITTGGQYVEQSSDLRRGRSWQAQYREEYQKQSPGSNWESTQKWLEENTKPEDKAYNEYMELKGNPPKIGGVPDWDTWDRQLKECLKTQSPEVQAYILRRQDDWINKLPPEVQPIERMHLQDSDYLSKSGYWQLPSLTEQREQGIKKPIDYTGAARTQYPKIDAMLALWYDYPSLKTKEALYQIVIKYETLGMNPRESKMIANYIKQLANQ